MAANPIVEIVTKYLTEGKTVKAVRANNRIKPTAIIVTLGNGIQHEHAIEAANRTAFMKIWKPAVTKLTISWDRLDQEASMPMLPSPAAHARAKKKAKKKR